MVKHYFTNDSNLSDELNIIKEEINGISYRFYTDSGVFSKSKVDFGSVLLIKVLIEHLDGEGTFLDLGSGYGPIGIVVKRNFPKITVHQTDINEKAVIFTSKNSKLNKVTTKCYQSDGFSNIKEAFDVISLNPPIRIGKQGVFALYDGVYNNLKEGGKCFIVIRKQQGALSHLEYLKKLFKTTEVVRKSKGYYVIFMQK